MLSSTKRKASATDKGVAKRSRHDDGGHFPFMKLPRELRDEVYKNVLEHYITLDRRGVEENSDRITESGLMCASKQISEEYSDVVLSHPVDITFTVKNHDFAHVIKFLNRISEAQLAKFRLYVSEDGANTANRSTQPRKRRFTIVQVYTIPESSTRPKLNCWLDRFNDPNVRGTEIDFQYKVDRRSHRTGGYSKQQPSHRKTASDRANTEAEKMRKAYKVHERPLPAEPWKRSVVSRLRKKLALALLRYQQR